MIFYNKKKNTHNKKIKGENYIKKKKIRTGPVCMVMTVVIFL